MRRAGIIFLMFVIILTGVIRIISLWGPVDFLDNTKTVIKINEGSSTRKIGRKLYDNGLISSEFWFDTIVSIVGLDDDLQAGYYEFKSSNNLWDFIKDLSEGNIATYKVTIPEGYTVEDISDRLSKLTKFDKEDYIELAKKGDFNEEFLPPQGINVKYRLEGFLYPDTYIIPTGSKPEEIFNILLTHFEKKWWNKLQKGTTTSQFTPYQIITIASLIENEAKLADEKPLVAAVIYNRLKKGMLLQIDASIQYSLDQRKQRILYKDLKIDSPYNTYLYPGLPPGPICNPGSESIKAALKPADVDYLFYFALKDGSHVFTKSYQEHLKQQSQMKKKGLLHE